MSSDEAQSSSSINSLKYDGSGSGSLASPSPPSVTDIKSVSQIGCYSLGKKLGEGAFAVVREGRHILTDMKVAVKLFDKHAQSDEYTRKNLKREGDILRRL